MGEDKRSWWKRKMKKQVEQNPEGFTDYWTGDPGYVDTPPDDTPPPPPKKKKWWQK